jgi:ribosome-associated heat shock protein Hsp15
VIRVRSAAPQRRRRAARLRGSRGAPGGLRACQNLFVRLDVWLDVACLFRTRSEAQTACKGGKVDLNGQAAKPHREVKPGDEVVITRPLGRRQRVVIKGLAEHHVAKAQARELYQDVTPPASPEEAEMRRLARLARPFVRPAGAGSPDKRERRQLRRLKERG